MFQAHQSHPKRLAALLGRRIRVEREEGGEGATRLARGWDDGGKRACFWRAGEKQIEGGHGLPGVCGLGPVSDVVGRA